MNARRFFAAAGVAAVAAVAGALSYRHQSELAYTHGQPHALALAWPLCVDGLVMATGIAISTDRAGGYRPRLWALVGFWLGVVVSVATNWLATEGGLINHGVSAFPALAFLVAVESLSAKPRPRKTAQAATVPVSVRADTAAEPARMSHPAPTLADMTATVASPAISDTSPLAGAAMADTSTLAGAATLPTTAARVRQIAATMPGASAAAIAAAVGVSERTVYRHLRTGVEQLADKVPTPGVAVAGVAA